MLEAYDTFLSEVVFAELAVEDDICEQYRYECARCGQEVLLAAVDSTNMVSHFRHRSGNSDVECEFYLGKNEKFTSDARSRKSKNARAEFYFDINKKMFYLGLRFCEDEILDYEQLSATFELRVASKRQPICSLLINGRNFTADELKLIPLEEFSNSYFLSNSVNSVERKYKVFNNITNTASTFFKLKAVVSGYRAKLVRSSVLLTHVPYFIVHLSKSKYRSPVNSLLPDEIKGEDSFFFETMGKKFLGKVLTITEKTAEVDSLLSSWGYQLEPAETLTLLWPPAILSEDISLIYSDIAFLYSTFQLQAHGNINIHSEDISLITDRLTKVVVKPRIKIYRKNAELILEACEKELDSYLNLSVLQRVKKNFQVEKDASFMFNRSGVLPLSKGINVQMTPKIEVRHYLSGYLDEIVVPPDQIVISKEQLLQDVLIHYKRTEPFDLNDFGSLEFSQTAFHYIKNCKKIGVINSAAKRLIKEGQI
jgi:hypothetical protein